MKEGAVIVNEKPRPVKVDIVLQYNDSYTDQILCFTNTINNPGRRLASRRASARR